MNDAVVVDIQPYENESDAALALAGDLVRLPGVRQQLPGERLRMADFRLLEKDGGEDAAFQAVIHDPDSYRSVLVNGRLSALGEAQARSVRFRPRPSAEEFAQAVEAVSAHPELSQILARDGAHPYRPMPPLADIEHADGTTDRIVTVGLRDPGGEMKHRIVGVRMRDGIVLPSPVGVPVPASYECETTPGVDDCPEGGPGHRSVRVRVRRGSSELWNLVVSRPAQSSGTNGSGAELRFVDYRGTRVLYQAHLPILNVQYGPDGEAVGCGPTYRDWQNQEACFTASGSEPAGPGYRLCSTAPATILDNGSDSGSFHGVAFHHDGSELRIVSELAAGWYRYISDWRFADDGVIRPRFGFAGVTNPCTCQVHTHHAYWRLNFDIAGAADDRVDEYNDPPIGDGAWTRLRFETRRNRHSLHRRQWRVVNRATDQGYHIVPGPNDSTADAYGAGDLWVVRRRGAEIDDGQGFTTDPALSRARIDGFVGGEAVDGRDLVVWYGGHFHHDEHDHTPRPHVVGPDLYPVGLS
ncbi:hypothetical protein [Streptomyces agglomeratus]|uniref:hypothetical protein n=1 Tax=Streptomyces agglomeratus TaxID=285458 RepID=UPI000A6681AA|nr:hypothetical protein [Streptomyces agglomeratus]